jgi:peptidoglycan/xylan/chitin deacetylase (PgdA/CDA1 family)
VPRAPQISRVVAIVLVTSLAMTLPSGCSRAGASGKNARVTPEGGASATTDATRSAAPKPVAPKPGTIPTDSLVPMLPADAFQPPSFVGYERLPCFTYHHVDPKLNNSIAIKPSTFEAQLKVLKDEGYHTITARQLAEYHAKGTPLPEKPVMITFDDGWKNQFQYAAPLLKKYGFVATFFVNPQLIGRGSAYMTRGMLVALKDAGNDIESHTWTHLALTRQREESQQDFQNRIMRQMTLADTWLKQVVGSKPVALCYPFGYYDIEAASRAKAAGYKLAFTTDEGVADARPWDAMIMKRFTVNRADSLAGFKTRLHSGVLEARHIGPPPASRVRGITTTVSVDITDVPAEVRDIRISSGTSMKGTAIERRGGRRYAVARLNKARVGFRQITLRGVDASGRRYYYAWSLVMGD